MVFAASPEILIEHFTVSLGASWVTSVCLNPLIVILRFWSRRIVKPHLYGKIV